MSPEEFQQAYAILPEAMLISAADGRILAANSAAAELLGCRGNQVAGARLFDYAADPEPKLRRFLLLCRRGRQFLPAGMTLRRPDHTTLACRCEGALIPAADGSAAQLLLRIVPRQTAAGRFTSLNDRIHALNRELALRRHSEEEVLESNRSLERVNESLRQFAYAAGHDLKEPLRTVKVFSQMLAARYGPNLDRQGEEFLRFIAESAGRMQAMVDDLLSFTEAGEAVGQAASVVDLQKVLQTVLENVAVSAAETSAVITHDRLPVVKAHERPLVQLFQNLIANGIKYRKPGVPPRIHVSAEPKSGEWIFSVRDNGVGIAPEYHRYVFGIFKRLSRNDGPGTGIGLAICQRVVEAYGGRIWIESEEGQGATFLFTLPGAAVAQVGCA